MSLHPGLPYKLGLKKVKINSPIRNDRVVICF